MFPNTEEEAMAMLFVQRHLDTLHKDDPEPDPVDIYRMYKEAFDEIYNYKKNHK